MPIVRAATMTHSAIPNEPTIRLIKMERGASSSARCSYIHQPLLCFFRLGIARLWETNAQGARDYFKRRRQPTEDFTIQLNAHFFVFVGRSRNNLSRQH